ALDCKAFLCADPRRFASGYACSCWYDRFCCGFATQRFVRPNALKLASFAKAQPSGDGIGCGGSNQQPGLPMMTLLPRSAYETSRPLREGRERRVVFGQRPGKQQWVATQQPAGNARLAAAATGCDEAAERRRPASPTLHALPPSLRLSQSGDGVGFGGKLSVRELPCA